MMNKTSLIIGIQSMLVGMAVMQGRISLSLYAFSLLVVGLNTILTCAYREARNKEEEKN